MSYQPSSAPSVWNFSGHILTAEENLDVELINGSSAMLAVLTMPKSSVIPDSSRGVKSSRSRSNVMATESRDLSAFFKTLRWEDKYN